MTSQTLAAETMHLLSPLQVGPYHFPNRIVMAPLTRNRAGAGNVPTDLNTIYYTQRASAGLLITEATQISPQGVGYPNTPGIHSPAQVAGWRQVTEAVHAAGGRIFLQLWHVGRVSHPDLQPSGALPVAPSAIAPAGHALTYTGPQPFVTPRALTPEEIPQIVEDYRQGAANALTAGFDGVEIHAANGYLLDQFLRDGTNHRTDHYGGLLENRMRLLREVTNAVVTVWGGNRVGVRLSPGGTFNSMKDSNSKATFGYAAEALNRFGLAYLHIREADEADLRYGGEQIPVGYFRPLFQGILMVNCGYGLESGNQILATGDADLVAFGKLFIANPDLPERFRRQAPLNRWDEATFYGGGEAGYTDYPTLAG
jgi:N-ethylmaleimide reductase